MQTFEEMLAAWEQAKSNLTKLTAEERRLRVALFGGAVPTPREGVNNVELADGRVCKFTYSISRKLTDGPVAWQNLQGIGIDPYGYIKIKYDLNGTAYRDAPENVVKVLSDLVIVKPGVPQLTVV